VRPPRRLHASAERKEPHVLNRECPLTTKKGGRGGAGKALQLRTRVRPGKSFPFYYHGWKRTCLVRAAAMAGGEKSWSSFTRGTGRGGGKRDNDDRRSDLLKESSVPACRKGRVPILTLGVTTNKYGGRKGMENFPFVQKPRRGGPKMGRRKGKENAQHLSQQQKGKKILLKCARLGLKWAHIHPRGGGIEKPLGQGHPDVFGGGENR